MVETVNVLSQEKHASIGLAQPNIDIERICQEYSEAEKSPKVFLMSSRSVANSLVAVKVEFLEDGQHLTCPGLPLVGAAFDPDWGFARVEIELHQGKPGEFRVPSGHPDTFTSGDTWGYRLCPIENHEIPDVIRQLAHIRAELAKPRQHSETKTGIEVSITEL
jgi:hypothetical protein